MLATLNLQLATTDLSGESLPLQVFSPEDGSPDVGGFAALLNLRVDDLQPRPAAGGQILPPDGNPLPLPEPDIVITVDDQPVPTATASAAPEVGELVTPLVQEIEPLPQDENLPAEIPMDLRTGIPAEIPTDPRTGIPAEIPTDLRTVIPAEIPAADKVAPVTTPPVVIPGPVTPAATAEESSSRGHAAEQRRDMLPNYLQQLRPPIAQQQGEVQLEEIIERPGTLVPPGLAAERQHLTQRRMPVTSQGSDAIDPVVERTERPPVIPVAMPVVDRLAEAMRSRVRPGQTIAATNGHAQPAAFQPLANTSPLSDSNFASTLAQQGTDLIRTPVMEPAWGDRIGERVVMLAGNQLKSAEIRLTPAELGPVRVQVSVEDGAANVTFHAQHAVTREALEQALPRLREMLAESGLTLGQADVSEHGVSQGNRDSDSDSATPGPAADDIANLADGAETLEVRTGVATNGLVDTFA